MTEDAARLPLSRKINRLFATMHPRSAPERSTASVAEQVSKALLRTIPAEHLERMRDGMFDEYDTSAVGADVLAALAHCFGVKPDYLTGSSPLAFAIDRELELLATMRDANVASIALRGSDVDPGRLTAVIQSTEAVSGSKTR
ncbi:hypothetical protein [Nocardia sp. XZ_19_385]|uniref:hypothetical protein n=1 Tax=Nocardia sp. XZ_19_385 TaxID=2769488 RepID=UPI00188FB0B5|nr:hypothetical protein [Nocardia sp. XZ_19_385]